IEVGDRDFGALFGERFRMIGVWFARDGAERELSARENGARKASALRTSRTDDGDDLFGHGRRWMPKSSIDRALWEWDAAPPQRHHSRRVWSSRWLPDDCVHFVPPPRRRTHVPALKY